MDARNGSLARTAPAPSPNGTGPWAARPADPLGGPAGPRAEALRTEIEGLCMDALRLSSIQDALLALNRTCEHSFASFRVAKGEHDRFVPVQYEPLDVARCLRELAALGDRLPAEADEAALRSLERKLKVLRKRLDLKRETLRVLFINLAHPALDGAATVDDLVSRIGHRALRAEAETSRSIIHRLVARLRPRNLTRGDLDILDEEALSAVGAMTQIAKHLSAAKNLVRADRRRRDQTAFLVIGYIAGMLGLAVYLALQAGLTPPTAQRTLDQFMLPFIGIPCTVVLWSAIGSFAAMLYRFNRHPTHEFTDAAKWLVTRPVQGVVVGSAFYLVFAAGLFLVGATPAGPGNAAGLGAPGVLGSAAAAPRDLLILVLAFLVGFSDRFGDAVFNALVERYAPGPREGQGLAAPGLSGRAAEASGA